MSNGKTIVKKQNPEEKKKRIPNSIEEWVSFKFPMDDKNKAKTSDKLQTIVSSGEYCKIPRTLKSGGLENHSGPLKLSGSSKKIADNEREVSEGKWEDHGQYVYLSHFMDGNKKVDVHVCGQHEDVSKFMKSVYGVSDIDAKTVTKVDSNNCKDSDLIENLQSLLVKKKKELPYNLEFMKKITTTSSEISKHKVNPSSYKSGVDVPKSRSTSVKSEGLSEYIQKINAEDQYAIVDRYNPNNPNNPSAGISTLSKDKMEGKFLIKATSREGKTYNLSCSLTKNGKAKLISVLENLNVRDEVDNHISNFDKQFVAKNSSVPAKR